MVKQMPNTGMPKSKYGKQYYNMEPEVALNLNKGFPPMKKPVRPHKRF